MTQAARMVPHESDEQRVVMEWAVSNESRWPEVGYLFHIPNGGFRNGREAKNLQRQGVKAGVPDLCLPVARGGWHGMYIEMKSLTGKTSPAQRGWLAALQAQGYYAVVCKGADEAISEITAYMNKLPT